MWELKEEDPIKCGNRYFNVKLVNAEKKRAKNPKTSHCDCK